MTDPMAMGVFATTIQNKNYSHVLEDGNKEDWAGIAHRVIPTVMKSVRAPKAMVEEMEELARLRKFVPGGRYLYATGNPYHQTQNCVLLRADDSREGWAECTHKHMMALMSGAGTGCDYSDVRAKNSLIRKTGGTATGPIALMQINNEAGRHIRQGGNRRAAEWAGLSWRHADIFDFIHIKDWSPEIRAAKAKDYNFPAPLDGTNISVLLDDEFFAAYHDASNDLHEHAQKAYWETVAQMKRTGEPGFSIDCGKNAGETLRNAPICTGTAVLTSQGYQDVLELVDRPVTVWTGKQWAQNVIFKKTSDGADVVRVSFTGGRELRCDRTHPFLVERYDGAGTRRRLVSVDRVPAAELKEGDILHVSLPEVSRCKELEAEAYTLGYVYGDGSFGNGGNNAEITFCTDESKKCADVVRKSAWLSSVTEVDGRGYTRAYFKTDRKRWGGRSKDVFPVELYAATTGEIASFVAGLFDADGNWEPTQKRIRLCSRHEGFLRGVARLLEQIGILAGVSKNGNSTYGKSQVYQLVVMGDYAQRFAHLIPGQRIKPDLLGYTAYRRSTIKVQAVEEDGVEAVYCADVKVEEHSFQAEGVIISNCTEITSSDDSDICNLGSINMARIESLEEFKRVLELGVAFLVAGTVYSDLPFPAVDKARTKNRRLGLGLMGLHEWLLKHGKRYGADSELEEYLKIYATATKVAAKWAKEWKLSRPVKTRAIAPNGTIGIVAETTTGIEPIFCVAYKRRYLKDDVLHYQYVIDPTAKRLIESGIDPDAIEDAYTLAEDVERRVAFQAWVQGYVDHAISSTINLPAWGTPLNDEGTLKPFGEMLIKYLPQLRGITCYPDGSRGGQPLTRVKYATACKHEGQEFSEVVIEQADACEITKAGSCGA